MTDKSEILEEIRALSLHYPRRQLSPKDQLRWLEDYADDMGGYRPMDVRLACAQWRQSEARGMPTPGELITKCRAMVSPDRITRQAPERPRVSPEERARVGEMMRAWAAERRAGEGVNRMDFRRLSRRPGETEVDQARRLWPSREVRR